ncbi:MAG: preprotein translocase subunit SecA, partial [Flavobacteriaceae bacterium]|nr:preprotein translocase subunit SecA [Flavobacteriaceae bacterium]
MSFINSVLKVFVGDKKKKDLKLLQPIVADVKSFDDEMATLTLDQLRAKTVEFKNKIDSATKPVNDKIEQLESEIEQANIDRKEDIYKEIDQFKDEAYQVSEEVLNDIQAEAFAVMKETAKRFVNNSSLKVKATPFDREMSTKEYVNLEGEDAIWNNSWDAAGKPITWDMVHYDV